MSSKIKYNVLTGLIVGVVFILLESIFRLLHNHLIDFMNLKEYVVTILIFTLGSFLTRKIFNIFIFILSLLFLLQVAHFNYFGYFLFPMEFILFFSKNREVLDTLVTKLDILIEPFIYTIVLYLSITKISIIRNIDLRITNIKFNYILSVIIIIAIGKTALHYNQRLLGDRPNENKSVLRNSLYLSKTLIGKTLPLYLFDIQIVKQYEQKNHIKQNSKNEIDNVILIIGESLSLHYMGIYGYSKKTTPNLNRLSKNKNYMKLKAISGGVYTDTSIPMLLNMAPKPNAVPHILSFKNNLFKMAKDNNYKTYFITSQTSDGFSYIRSYMGTKFIDNYTDSTNFGFDKFTPAPDIDMVNKFKKIDLNRKNFIVLNMMGSHEPYEQRVPNNFIPFGVSSTLNHYENSVAYTDLIISTIIKHVQSINSKTLIIFTSDHGQHVGINGFGKGDIRNNKDYEVPLIIFSNGFTINKDIKNILSSEDFTSHYIISLITAYYLGYDTLKYTSKRYYTIGSDLSGNAGYLEYNATTKSTNIY